MSIAEQLKALADPTRRSIFDLIRSQPASVRELSDLLPVSQPAVSQHLKVLAGARLARSEARGRQHIYSADPEGIRSLKGWIDDMWDDVLDAFVDAAQREVHDNDRGGS